MAEQSLKTGLCRSPAMHPHLASIRSILEDVRHVTMSEQSEDGSWRYLLEGSVLANAYYILVEALFPPSDRLLVESLARSMERRQMANGGFGLFPEHPGDFSTTLEAYLALRLAGRPPEAESVAGAKRFLCATRHEQNLSNLTRVTLAALGVIPWSAVPVLPPEIILLPGRVPFSLYDLASYTRVHMPAIMLLAAMNASREVSLASEIRALLAPRHLRATACSHPLLGRLDRLLGPLLEPMVTLWRATGARKRSMELCRRFIRDRVEADGTLGSYLLSTIFSMFALSFLGRPEDAELVCCMKAGLRGFTFEKNGELLMQPCTSAVWDTALNVAALRRLGVSDSDASLLRAVDWLLDREITVFPDLWKRTPAIRGGAWGFQAVNRFYPDVDDTCAVLTAISGLGDRLEPRVGEAFARGVEWVLAMQNRDGGFSAFDVNSSRQFLERLPFNDMGRAMIDPSSADMTGRTVMFLCDLRDGRAARSIQRGLAWLYSHQETDGSWWGRWGISFIYGTWAALLGLGAAGVNRFNSKIVERGCNWLRSVQNGDGGWGESCRSDVDGCFVGRSESTPSQTAWALEGLLASGCSPREAALRRGIEFLIERYRPGIGWEENYPTGAGFAGKLYLIYHNYGNLWPTMTLLRAGRILEMQLLSRAEKIIRPARCAAL
ncbi:MAG: squalene--hopene cyclase [Syntrophobacteraceae bacterium]|nr:squalene--hopene cyclase [Syntrophobacteraceae bacterium]